MQRLGVLQGRRLPRFVVCAQALMCLGISAAPMPVQIQYEAPPGCGSRRAFFLAMKQRLPRIRSTSSSAGRDLEIRVRLEQMDSGVRGRLSVRGEGAEANDEREVIGMACHEVVEALALTAVLALEQREEARRIAAEAEHAKGGTSKPGAAPETASRRVTGEASPPEDSTEGAVDGDGLEASISSGSERDAPPSQTSLSVLGFATQVVAPTVSVGAGIEARAAVPIGSGWRPVVGLALLFAPRELLQPAADTTVQWAVAVIHACPASWQLSRRVSVLPCAIGSAGWLSVTSQASAIPLAADRSWWATGGLLRGEFGLGRDVAMEFELALQVPLVHRTFITTLPSQTVAETPVASWLGGLGASYRF